MFLYFEDFFFHHLLYFVEEEDPEFFFGDYGFCQVLFGVDWVLDSGYVEKRT